VLAGRWLQAEGYRQDVGEPEDAAAMAVFIASDEAGSFTGQDVNTPGGYVMW
jgi:NAD(P)-dependent dehydrogenase (short-subunit alcohol dehydrogenase family)